MNSAQKSHSLQIFSNLDFLAIFTQKLIKKLQKVTLLFYGNQRDHSPRVLSGVT